MALAVPMDREGQCLSAGLRGRASTLQTQDVLFGSAFPSFRSTTGHSHISGTILTRSYELSLGLTAARVQAPILLLWGLCCCQYLPPPLPSVCKLGNLFSFNKQSHHLQTAFGGNPECDKCVKVRNREGVNSGAQAAPHSATTFSSPLVTPALPNGIPGWNSVLASLQFSPCIPSP